MIIDIKKYVNRLKCDKAFFELNVGCVLLAIGLLLCIDMKTLHLLDKFSPYWATFLHTIGIIIRKILPDSVLLFFDVQIKTYSRTLHKMDFIRGIFLIIGIVVIGISFYRKSQNNIDKTTNN